MFCVYGRLYVARLSVALLFVAAVNSRPVNCRRLTVVVRLTIARRSVTLSKFLCNAFAFRHRKGWYSLCILKLETWSNYWPDTDP